MFLRLDSAANLYLRLTRTTGAPPRKRKPTAALVECLEGEEEVEEEMDDEVSGDETETIGCKYNSELLLIWLQDCRYGPEKGFGGGGVMFAIC